MKKFLKAILFPHIAILIILLPFSLVYLIYSMVIWGNESIISIISYVLSAYTLTVWCLKIPKLIAFFKNFKNKNAFLNKLKSDARFRTNLSLYGTLIFNSAYGIFKSCLGFYHKSFWYFSLSGYYILLAVMRFFLLTYLRKNSAGENMIKELKKYRFCGIIFLLMNIYLAIILFFMVYWGRTFIHSEITAITMAVYTFSSLTFAIINVIKYKKYNSPVYSASKIISLASASVSILTLESTLLTVFGDGNEFFSKLMLTLTGTLIIAFIIFMAVCMIKESNKKISLFKENFNG